MRKVLSFVLVLSLVLGSLGMAFAAPLSDVKDEDCEEAVNVLTQLDVIKGYPDGSYKPENIVTRAEMAVIVISALGLKDYAVGTSSFTDMAGYDWAQGYVAYAQSLGIINGYPDGTFRPGKTVSYDEAATMLVGALGYNEDSLVGTWPANYVTKAKTLGIMKGIQAGATGANRGDIAIMTYQTLDKEIGKTSKDGEWKPSIPADSMMSRLEAELYAPEFAYNPNEDDVAGAEFVVTGDEDSVISLKEFQGALVTAYANDDNEIIAIKEVLSTFITEKFKDANSDSKIDANEKFGDYKVKSGFVSSFMVGSPPVSTAGVTYVFNNGGIQQSTPGTDDVVTDAVFTDGVEYTLAVKISGNYITKIYSVAILDASAPGKADKISKDDLDDIADCELFGSDFKQNNKDEIDLDYFALFGANSLEDIDVDNVVYVYDDGDYIARIDVGTEVVEGTVSKITSSGTKATISGKEYKISAYASATRFDTAAGFGVKVGDTVELYLDYYGKVFDVDVIDGEAELLALAVDWEINIPTKMSDPDPVVKLFLADGTVKTFVIEDDYYDTPAKVTALQNKFNSEVAGGEGSGGTVGNVPGAGIIRIGSVVEYDLNKKGEISSIKAIDISGTKGGAVAAAGGADISKGGIYDGKYISSNATIFTTDANLIAAQNGAERAGNKDKDFGITTYDKVLGLEGVNGYYHYDSTAKKIDWMVIEGGGSDDDIFVAWNDWAKVDTDAGYEAYVMVDGKETTYEANSESKAKATASTRAGVVDGSMTLYKIKLASDGTVSSFDEVDSTLNAKYSVVDINYASGDNRVKNNVLTITTTPAGAKDDDYTLDKNITVYVWDDEWVKGSANAFNKATDYPLGIVLYDIDDDGAYDYAFVR